MNPDIFIPLTKIKFSDVSLWLLSFGGFIWLLDAIGLLPPKLSKFLNRNKSEATLRALKELGVRVEWEKESSARLKPFQKLLARTRIKEPSYKIQLRKMLAQDSYEGEFDVGRGSHFEHKIFIDVMGGTSSHKRAETYARLLNSHAQSLSLKHFDGVACPKTGSPFLAYEFSKIKSVPLILGAEDKVRAGEHTDFHQQGRDRLDYPSDLKLSGRTILLVDDSTTGGRKLVELAKNLRNAGAKVEQALVLFEPKGKGARARLEENEVQLIAVESGPVGRR